MRAIRAGSRMHVFIMMLLLSAVIVSGCEGRKAPDGKNEVKTVVIGAVLPLSGSIATYGEECRNGIRLAVEEINSRGKFRIEVIYEDNKGEPTETNKAVVKHIQLNNVVAIIGAVASSSTLAAVDEAQATKVPLITPASTNTKVTQAGNYISRVCFIDPFQGYVMAKFARENLKAATAVVMQDRKSDYSKGLALEFQKTFKKMGGEVKEVLFFSAGDKDFNPLLTKVKQLNPDVVFVPAYYTEVGTILNQAATKGLNMPFLGGDGWDSPKLYDLAGKGTATGHYFSSHFSPEDTDPLVQEFVKKYTAKFNGPPGALAGLGYDTALVIEDALLRAAAVTPEEIMKAINTVKNLRGVTGVITIDENRNARKSAVILETKGQKAVFKARVNP